MSWLDGWPAEGLGGVRLHEQSHLEDEVTPLGFRADQLRGFEKSKLTSTDPDEHELLCVSGIVDLVATPPAPAPPLPVGKTFGLLTVTDRRVLGQLAGSGLEPYVGEPYRYFTIERDALTRGWATGDDRRPTTTLEGDACSLLVDSSLLKALDLVSGKFRKPDPDVVAAAFQDFLPCLTRTPGHRSTPGALNLLRTDAAPLDAPPGLLVQHLPDGLPKEAAVLDALGMRIDQLERYVHKPSALDPAETELLTMNGTVQLAITPDDETQRLIGAAWGLVTFTDRRAIGWIEGKDSAGGGRRYDGVKAFSLDRAQLRRGELSSGSRGDARRPTVSLEGACWLVVSPSDVLDPATGKLRKPEKGAIAAALAPLLGG